MYSCFYVEKINLIRYTWFLKGFTYLQYHFNFENNYEAIFFVLTRLKRLILRHFCR